MRVIGYNFRDRMNVKDKENWTKHWHFCLILYSFSFAAFMNWSVQFYEPLFVSIRLCFSVLPLIVRHDITIMVD